MSTHTPFADPDAEHSSPEIAKRCKVCRPPKPVPKPPTIAQVAAAMRREAVRPTPGRPPIATPVEKRVRVEPVLAAPGCYRVVCDHCGARVNTGGADSATRLQAAHVAIHGMV